ncbi:ATP-dependent helicase, partial [bacterium]|nr:ATP-dependent helicase [bacterium]
QWLHALHAPDGLMEGDKDELVRFEIQTQDWKRPVTVSADTPFRLCFRLEEPAQDLSSRASDKNQWYVRYLLQDMSDPSLIIPANEIWKAKGKKAAWLNRRGFNVREYLLASLGQVSRVCPNIDESLKTPEPAGYATDSNGAFHFLIEIAPIFEQMNFGVMLPAWWTRKGSKQQLSVRAHAKNPKMKATSNLSLNQVLQFQWEAVLAGEKITLRELKRLAKLKSSLVQVRGQWVHIRADEIQQAIAFLQNKDNKEKNMRDLVQMALGRADTPAELEFEGVSSTGWLSKFLDRLQGNASYDEIEVPNKFRGTLRPYQKRGYSWLHFLQQWGLGACLADDMGLGKTVQTLALIQQNRHEKETRPVLLICPTSVVGNWRKEAERFTPGLSVMIHHGVSRKKGNHFQNEAAKHSIVISSYALLHRD